MHILLAIAIVLIPVLQDAPSKEGEKKGKLILRKPHNIKVGDEFYLGTEGKYLDVKYENQDVAIIAIALFCDEYVKYVVAGDGTGIKEMIRGNRLFTTAHGTKAKILQLSKIPFKNIEIFEVRLLDGEMKDKKGYVFSHDIFEPVDLELAEKRKVQAQKELDQEREAQEKLTAKNREQAEKRKSMEAKAKADKKLAEDEAKAAELLKHAKRWLAEGDKELAKKRLDDLLKRFPTSQAAPEAKKLLGEIGK
jgi:hypothetical protein